MKELTFSCFAWIRAIAGVVAFCAMAINAYAEPESEYAYYFVAPRLGLNNRLGRFAIPDSDIRLDSVRVRATSGGVAAGRQISITSALRINVAFSFEYGSAVEETLFVNYFTRYSFTKFGLAPGLDVVLPFSESLRPFVSIEGGINYTIFEEKFFSISNPYAESAYDEHFNSRLWRPHAKIGGGFEIPLVNELSLSFGYFFRFIRPIAFEFNRELPLGSWDYSESFFTHLFQIKVIFGMER